MARRAAQARKAEVIEDVESAGTGRARGGPKRSVSGGPANTDGASKPGVKKASPRKKKRKAA